MSKLFFLCLPLFLSLFIVSVYLNKFIPKHIDIQHRHELILIVSKDKGHTEYNDKETK